VYVRYRIGWRPLTYHTGRFVWTKIERPLAHRRASVSRSAPGSQGGQPCDFYYTSIFEVESGNFQQNASAYNRRKSQSGPLLEHIGLRTTSHSKCTRVTCFVLVCGHVYRSHAINQLHSTPFPLAMPSYQVTGSSGPGGSSWILYKCLTGLHLITL
jgi:hypothetical protein